MRTTDPRTVAYILTKEAFVSHEALGVGRWSMAPTRLQRWLYIVNAQHIADEGEPLFPENAICTSAGPRYESVSKCIDGGALVHLSMFDAYKPAGAIEEAIIEVYVRPILRKIQYLRSHLLCKLTMQVGGPWHDTELGEAIDEDLELMWFNRGLSDWDIETELKAQSNYVESKSKYEPTCTVVVKEPQMTEEEIAALVQDFKLWQKEFRARVAPNGER